MNRLPDEVKTAMDKTKPTCVATVNNDGVPNIIYVTFLKYINDTTVVIADNKLVKTKANILDNGNVSFVVLDPDTKKAYQVKGVAEYVEAGDRFQDVHDWVKDTRPDLKSKGAVYISINEIFSGDQKIV